MTPEINCARTYWFLHTVDLKHLKTTVKTGLSKIHSHNTIQMEMRWKQINTLPNITKKFGHHHGNFHDIKHEFCDKIVYYFHCSNSIYLELWPYSFPKIFKWKLILENNFIVSNFWESNSINSKKQYNWISVKWS